MAKRPTRAKARKASPKPTSTPAAKKSSAKSAKKKAVRKTKPKPKPKPKAGPATARAAAPPPDTSPDGSGMLAEAVGRLEARVCAEIAAAQDALLNAIALTHQADSGTGTPEPDPSEPGADLDQVTRAFHRTLADVLDRQGESLGVPLATVHGRLLALADASGKPGQAVGEQLRVCAADLAGVLDRLGIERFQPQVGDVFDPLVHTAVADETARGVEPGRVSRVVSGGYASARGRILVPSRVVLSRG